MNDELQNKLAGKSIQEVRESGRVVSIPDRVGEQVAQLAAAGVHRLLLQWTELDNIAGAEALARALL